MSGTVLSTKDTAANDTHSRLAEADDRHEQRLKEHSRLQVLRRTFNGNVGDQAEALVRWGRVGAGWGPGKDSHWQYLH